MVIELRTKYKKGGGVLAKISLPESMKIRLWFQ